MGVNSNLYRIAFSDTTALQTSKVKVLVPFKPSKVEVRNLDNAAKPEYVWTKLDDDESTGGIKLSVVGGAPTRTALTTTTGFLYKETGLLVRYNNPATPTYQDNDGVAVVAGSIIDQDGDFLSRLLPQLGTSSDNGNQTLLSRWFELPTAANQADLRGDGENIELLFYR